MSVYNYLSIYLVSIFLSIYLYLSIYLSIFYPLGTSTISLSGFLEPEV